jgi:lipid-A-disaccharide synthase-like uncharacterized protein
MNEKTWLIIGISGQFLFSIRFIIQWIISEIKKTSVIPIYFWYFSILGSIFLLSYAIYRKDMVFISGQSIGILIYFRNLILLKRKNNESVNC